MIIDLSLSNMKAISSLPSSESYGFILIDSNNNVVFHQPLVEFEKTISDMYLVFRILSMYESSPNSDIIDLFTF